MIIYSNNSKISPLSLPFQVFFFFPFPNRSSTTADSFPFICLFFSFFENFRQKGQGDIEFFVVMMLMGCLAFGSREFSFFHIPVHAWSSSSCYFLVGPLLVSGVLKKILNLFVIWHQHQFGFKRLYLSWNHSVIQVSKIFWCVVKSKLLIKWFPEMGIRKLWLFKFQSDRYLGYVLIQL